MTLKAKGLSSYYYFSYSSSSSSACRAMVSLIPFLQLSLILVAAFQFRNSNNSMESLLTAYFHLPARFSTGFFLRIIRPLNCLSYTNICTNKYCKSYVYRTVHHLDRWIKRDQLDVTCFFISLFHAQYVSDVNTSIFRSLRLICWVISWAVLLWHDVCWCYVVVWLVWCGIRMQAEALLQPASVYNIEPEQHNPWNNATISRKLLKMDVLTFETCWAVNNEIIKQVTSSWSIFIQA